MYVVEVILTVTESMKIKINETVKTLLLSCLFALSARAALAETRMIPSESMQPTLEINDRLVIEKVSLYTGQIERGEIVVFYPPYYKDEGIKTDISRFLSLPFETPLIKRVIGLPGEIVEIKEGKVFINGKVLSEPYLSQAIKYRMAPQLIPANEVFVMGDNRNNSFDSHIWGTQPLEDILGVAVLRFWPPARVGLLNK